MGCLDGLQSIFAMTAILGLPDPIVFVEAQQKTPGFNGVDAKDTDDGIHLWISSGFIDGGCLGRRIYVSDGS